MRAVIVDRAGRAPLSEGEIAFEAGDYLVQKGNTGVITVVPSATRGVIVADAASRAGIDDLRDAATPRVAASSAKAVSDSASELTAILQAVVLALGEAGQGPEIAPSVPSRPADGDSSLAPSV